ncbi:hypothetical protein GNIT_2438 [Glaciecola nitratireducens FR1064]|uniref:Uncharacterized protein n=1 Tax=Glaciecola nitratireducens (strain JCM 12485 / KCTC 12276 / FR1064) TaxID=1085623 RepID=G4QI02_GLANF|nr:hypothetical protein GNIT_2438 [Glaciecola nitratireducens FR1064]
MAGKPARLKHHTKNTDSAIKAMILIKTWSKTPPYFEK